MNLGKKIIVNGWFVGRWGFIFSIGGLALAVIPWFFDLHVGLSLVLTFIGVPISLLGSYEAKARQFGFSAPFTNDPLGWRKAKKSYETKEDSDEEPKKGDPS
jgi:hypothetical protein